MDPLEDFDEIEEEDFGSYQTTFQPQILMTVAVTESSKPPTAKHKPCNTLL